MATSDELQELRIQLADEVKDVLDRTELENDGAGRDLTEDEARDVDEKQKRIEALGPRIDRARKMESYSQSPSGRKITPGQPDGGTRGFSGIVYRDAKSGREYRSIGPKEKLTELPGKNYGERIAPLAFGRAVVGIVTGKFDARTEHEQRAMSEIINTAGGYLVNDVLSVNVIDKARAAMVLVRAGAQTLEWSGGDVLHIARVQTDPTVIAKVENASFGTTEVGLSSLTITPYTVGCIVDMSRELAEDSINAAQLVETTMARALAQKVDYWGLRGTGSAEPLGITGFAANTITSVGEPEYDDILDAMKLILDDNHTPGAYVLSPAAWLDLSKLKTGDAVNAAKQYMDPPPALDALQQLVTSACPTGNIVVGDFSRLVIAVRQQALVEASTKAGERFDRHQVGVKITMRVSFAAEWSDAFCVLSGVT